MSEGQEFTTALNLVAAELGRVHEQLQEGNRRTGAIETQLSGMRVEQSGMNLRMDIANGRTSTNEQRVDQLSISIQSLTAELNRMKVAAAAENGERIGEEREKARWVRRTSTVLTVLRHPWFLAPVLAIASVVGMTRWPL